MGLEEGADVGLVGMEEGWPVGLLVGCFVGVVVGEEVGSTDVGALVGGFVSPGRVGREVTGDREG